MPLTRIYSVPGRDYADSKNYCTVTKIAVILIVHLVFGLILYIYI